MLDAVYVIIIAYLFGSIPTAIIAGKLLKNIDIREHGSGNAGATNVFRVLGPKWGIIVLIIDILKGFVPVFWLAALIHPQADTLIYYQILAAISAIAGHVWTIFAGFKGGKGVGTAAGVFLGLAPLPLSAALLIFVIIVAVSRYVSLGSLFGSLCFLLILLVQRFLMQVNIPDILLYLAVIVVAIIWYAHRSNIGRLFKGNENKISFGSSKE